MLSPQSQHLKNWSETRQYESPETQDQLDQFVGFFLSLLVLGEGVPLEVAAGTLEVIPAELCRDSLEILYGLFLSDSAPDYSEMGSPRTNKCISTDQAQEKGLDKCLISAQRPG